jgi:iron(III) transport system permease protein
VVADTDFVPVSRPAAPDPRNRQKTRMERLRASRLGAWLTPKAAVLLLVAAVVAYLSVTPLFFLIQQMLIDSDGVFTLDNIVSAYSDPIAAGMMWNSVVFTVGSTAIAMILGTALAYLHSRTDISFKPALFAASVIPLIMPGLVYTTAWVVLASPETGVLNLVAESLTGLRPLDIFSMWGMVWVEGTGLAPLVFLLMLAAFRSMDPSLEESAMVAGASGWQVVHRVTFPLVKPAFLAAALIMAIRALESFETPALLGIPGGIWVFTSRIWNEMSSFPADIGAASAYASILLIIAIIGVVVHNWYARRGGERSVQTIGGKAFRVRPRAIKGKARLAANSFVLAFVITVIVLPSVALVYSSLLPVNQAPSVAALEAMSFDNYAYVLGNEVVQRGALNSTILAIASATAVMFVMAIAAWMVVRTKIPGRGVLDTLSFIPMTFPGIVLGLALLFVYLRTPLPIYGTLLILFVAYLTKYMPYGMRYAATSMYQINNELEESAQVAGAGWWQSFRRVVLPLLTPGLMAGWIYIATISVRELSSSLLIYSPGNEVLAVSMWFLYNEARTNELSALSVIIMAALVVIVAIAYKLGSRVGIRQDATV